MIQGAVRHSHLYMVDHFASRPTLFMQEVHDIFYKFSYHNHLENLNLNHLSKCSMFGIIPLRQIPVVGVTSFWLQPLINRDTKILHVNFLNSSSETRTSWNRNAEGHLHVTRVIQILRP